jgi:hypothetical protein
MAKNNIWEDKSFSQITADFNKVEPEKLVNLKELNKSVIKKSSIYQSKEAKKVTKWRDELSEIIKKPMMIEKHIHIRMKRYCVDKEINIFDYTCDLIDRDLKKHGY